LIVDDFEPWRRAVRSILDHDSDFEVIGECSDGPDAVQKSGELLPDLILLDIHLPTMNGFVAAEQIRKISPETKILFLSAHRSFDAVREALRIGGGLVLKADASRDLLPVIRAVIRNEPSIRFSFLDEQPNSDEI